MPTVDFSQSGSQVAVTVGSNDPIAYSKAGSTYGFINDSDNLEVLFIEANITVSYVVNLADLLVSGANPATKEDALTAMGIVWAEGGGSNTPFIVEKTKSEIDTLISANGLVVGTVYKITGTQGYTGMHVDLFLKALETNKLSESGSGLFYNADYQNVGVYNEDYTQRGIWTSTLQDSLVNNDVVIYNGKHYLVIDDGEFNVSNPSENTNAYQLLTVGGDGNGYIEVIDVINYNYDNDYIYNREDEFGNKISFDYDYFKTTVEPNTPINSNPITRFQWGSNIKTGNVLNNSFLVCLNSEITYKGNYASNYSNIQISEPTSAANACLVNYNYLVTSDITTSSIVNGGEISYNTLVNSEYTGSIAEGEFKRNVIINNTCTTDAIYVEITNKTFLGGYTGDVVAAQTMTFENGILKSIS